MIFDVWLHGMKVGELRRVDGTAAAFAFVLDDAYLDATNRPVLGQVFEGDETTFNGDVWRLPAWFHELLPEGVLRRRIVVDAGLKSDNDVSLLGVVGGDLPGAVVVIGEGVPPLLHAPSTGVVHRYRWSLAGLQLKLSVLRHDDKVVLPVSGVGGRFLLKLPSTQYAGLARHEHAMLQWARRSGIDVPDHELVDVDTVDDATRAAFSVDEPALLIRRFDRRDDGERMHFEDFAQIKNRYADDDVGAADGDARYSMLNTETLLNTIQVVCPMDLREAFRRIVFVVLSGNGDAHAKNWALAYPDRRTARLSPAYDLVSTAAYGLDPRLALKLNDSGRPDVTADDLCAVMDFLDQPAGLTRSWLDEDVDAILSAWRDGAAGLFADHHRSFLTTWLAARASTLR